MGVDEEFRALLVRAADAVVAAFDPRGTLVPIPPPVPVGSHQAFAGSTGLDLILPADQRSVAAAWLTIDQEPIVRVPVHLLADPEREVTIHLFDVHDEYGVHMLVFEGHDLDAVARSSTLRAQLRKGTARVKRDGVSRFIEVDDAITDLLGWAPEQLLGRSTIEIVHPDDAEGAIELWMEMRAGVVSRRVRARLLHANGQYVWLEVSNENHLDDPELNCVITEFVDISAEMAEIEALQERERLLARLAEALPIGICQLRATREVVYSNEPLTELLGAFDSIDTMFRRIARPDRRALEVALEH